MSVLKAVEEVNERQKEVLFNKLMKHFNGDINGKNIAIWGLAFKPETDDMREAPSVVVINELLERGAKVVAHDPVARETAYAVLGDRIDYVDNNYDALEGADALIIVTEWAQYRNPAFDQIKAQLKQPVIFDGRNLYRPERMREQGIMHYSIGRSPQTDV